MGFRLSCDCLTYEKLKKDTQINAMKGMMAATDKLEKKEKIKKKENEEEMWWRKFKYPF